MKRGGGGDNLEVGNPESQNVNKTSEKKVLPKEKSSEKKDANNNTVQQFRNNMMKPFDFIVLDDKHTGFHAESVELKSNNLREKLKKVVISESDSLKTPENTDFAKDLNKLSRSDSWNSESDDYFSESETEVENGTLFDHQKKYETTLKFSHLYRKLLALKYSKISQIKVKELPDQELTGQKPTNQKPTNQKPIKNRKKPQHQQFKPKSKYKQRYIEKLEKILKTEGLEINMLHNIQVTIGNNYESLSSENRLNTCSHLSFEYLKEFDLPEFLSSYQDPMVGLGNYDDKVTFYSTYTAENKPDNEKKIKNDDLKSLKSLKSRKSSKISKYSDFLTPKDHLKSDIMKQIHQFLLELPRHRKAEVNDDLD